MAQPNTMSLSEGNNEEENSADEDNRVKPEGKENPAALQSAYVMLY